MKSATELLAEMMAIYDDPQKSPARLYLWIHQHKKQIRAAVERGDDSARLDWVEQNLGTISFVVVEDMVVEEIGLRAAIDRARGEGE